MAPFWAALLVLTLLGRSGSFSRGHLAWAAVILIVTQFGWLYVSGHWYEQRYGVVKEPEPPVRSALISIMHPEVRPPHAANGYYEYLSRNWAVLFLIWALALLPDIFLGRHGRSGHFAMLAAAFLIFPRCFHPVPDNWLIYLRRILAGAALIAMIGTYLDYRFAQIGLWTWMAMLVSVLLLLDLYDHWLLNYLLSRDFTEWNHE